MSSSGSHNFDRNQSVAGEPVAPAVQRGLRRQGTKHPLSFKRSGSNITTGTPTSLPNRALLSWIQQYLTKEDSCHKTESLT
jgi:hypothetical protein